MCFKKNKQTIQYEIGSPIGNEFPEDCYFPLKLFKKRIKDFPFIKKQPRFKKTLYVSETKGWNGEKKTYKAVTSWVYYKRNKQQFMKEAYDFPDLDEKGVLLVAYWIPTKLFYHPETLENAKNQNRWFLNEKSYLPFILEGFCLSKNKHLKIVGRCRCVNGENLFFDNSSQRNDFINNLLNYSWGLTDQKPSLEGYVIDKKVLKKMKKMEAKTKINKRTF